MSGKRLIKGTKDKSRCILICAGDMDLTEIEITEEDFCIAVDGGYFYCRLLGIEPDLIVGDFDSLEEEVLSALLKLEQDEPERVVRLQPMKDDTDTLAALRIGLQNGYKDYRIYGALGGRLEHTLANIQCLTHLKNRGAKGYLLDASSMITLIKEETVKLNRKLEGFVSLFSVSDKAEGVTLRGLKYPLTDATITNEYPIGISNEFIGEEASITVEKGTLLMIVSL